MLPKAMSRCRPSPRSSPRLSLSSLRASKLSYIDEKEPQEIVLQSPSSVEASIDKSSSLAERYITPSHPSYNHPHVHVMPWCIMLTVLFHAVSICGTNPILIPPSCHHDDCSAIYIISVTHIGPGYSQTASENIMLLSDHVVAGFRYIVQSIQK